MADPPGLVRFPAHGDYAEKIYLPNAHGSPVKQHRIALPGDTWWVRDDDTLWVRCLWWELAKTKTGRSYGRVWVPQAAPIPGWDDGVPDPLFPYRQPVELPDRPPNPDRITCALDLRGLYGPEVDEALGVSTPLDETVDAWEAGTLVPTHDEIRRLAVLTGMLPAWFYDGTLPAMGNVFLCPGAGFEQSLDDVARCPTCDQDMPAAHEHVEVQEPLPFA